MSVSHGPTVRTYRGRSLEELIPRIREELGPDAIILREREGLTGGVGGFFAQRCVEVDAQAPAGVDFYDEEEAVSPADDPEPFLPIEEEAQYPEAVEAEPEGPAPYAQAAAQYAEAVEPAPAPVMEAAPSLAVAPAPAITPSLTEELSFAQRLEQARREREAQAMAAGEPPVPEAPVTATADHVAPATATATTTVPATGTATVPATATATAPEPTGRPPTPTPYPTGVRTKLKVRPKPTRAPGMATTPRPVAAPAPAPEPVAAPTHGAAQLDAAAAGAVARELIGHGISEAWAHELIVAAAAHLAPFADHDGLREAVRAGMAAGISAAPLLPSSGAAVAFVGAGGAGKTRCAAAMAARYARASTLRVSVVTLTPGRGDVAVLLEGREIEVQALAGEAAADAVGRGRERGLVIIDTPATSPGDAPGVTRLAEELERAGVDAVYVTVPATLSASAARSLLDGLAPVSPTALVITHADETDDLGIVTELAYQTGLPIAFIHGGLDIDTALTIADPATVAERTLR